MKNVAAVLLNEDGFLPLVKLEDWFNLFVGYGRKLVKEYPKTLNFLVAEHPLV